MSNVLIVDDEETYCRNAARFLSREGHEAFTALTLLDGLTQFREREPDVVILDYRLPDGTGLDFIQKVRSQGHNTHIILITGHGTIELAVEAMKAGANDLMTKPVGLRDLHERIAILQRQARDSTRLKYLEERARGQTVELLGPSSAMQTLVQRVRRIAAVDGTETLPPVLITGETGTGKELVARACHVWSPRSQRPFIEINCAAMPAQLLETELFGHERGAFTDAKDRKIGLIEAADGGTLFMDEVGEMDLALQAKLLKVIEDGRFRRVGSVQEKQVQVRIVAATNRDLDERVREGAFRADLMFRLRVLQVQVPALRDRGDDAVFLAHHFRRLFAQRYRRPCTGLHAQSEALIRRHRWPGNVRELRNVIEQAVLMAGGDEIWPEDLMLPHTAHSTSASAAPPSSDLAGNTPGSTLDRMERDLLIKALQEAQSNVSQAARILGISRDTLRYRMDKHGLKG